MSLTASQYEALVSKELRDLVAALDECEALFETEQSADVITIEFPDRSKFILNTQRPAQQLWLAAERSAWHFEWNGSSWVGSKGQGELWEVLRTLLSQKTGVSVALAAR